MRAIAAGRALVLAAVAAMVVVPAGAEDDGRAPARPEEARVSGEREAGGEICAVCRKVLPAGEKAYLVKGRWIPVHAMECRDAFHEHPEIYFSSVSPSGALFSEAYASPPAMRWGWFLTGSYVLLGLTCAALCTQMAYPRGRSPSFWFGAGLLFNVLALAALAAAARPVRSMPSRLGKIPETAPPAPCPSCGAQNHPAAAVCLGCGGHLQAAYESEARRARPG